MMIKDETPEAILGRLGDFFWVYYGNRTSKMILNHPEEAIGLLRDAIKAGISSPGKLSSYASALRDAVRYHELSMMDVKKTRKDSIRAQYD